MNKHFSRPMALFVVATGACAVLSGCASSPDAGETVSSMGSFGVEVAKVKDSIDNSVKALEADVEAPAGDLRVCFDAYKESLLVLDRQAAVVRERAEEMRTTGDEFFAVWEPVEDVSPERRAELTASYARIKGDMTLAKEQFTPFQKSLKDVEGYLTLDLSPKGIDAMGDLAKQAKDNGAKVKASIDAVLLQMNSIRGMLSTR